MIDIVLDAHRQDESPTILVGELPGMIAHVHVSFVLTLRLHDARPTLSVTLKSDNRPLPYDYYFALTSQAHFMSWAETMKRFMVPGLVTAPLNVTLPATSSAGIALDVTVMHQVSPRSIRIFTYPSREVVVPKEMFDAWNEEFGRIMELAIAISQHVTELREQQREALLQHIDALLVRSALY